MDGLDALRSLREQADTPTFFVTNPRRELDQALGHGLGADDCVVKPFDLNVLLARIKAALRRSESVAPSAATTESAESCSQPSLDNTIWVPPPAQRSACWTTRDGKSLLR